MDRNGAIPVPVAANIFLRWLSLSKTKIPSGAINWTVSPTFKRIVHCDPCPLGLTSWHMRMCWASLGGEAIDIERVTSGGMRSTIVCPARNVMLGGSLRANVTNHTLLVNCSFFSTVAVYFWGCGSEVADMGILSL